MKFIYTVARFVPDSVRGEFINIAIVVVGPDAQVVWQHVSDYSRARAIGPADLLDFCVSHLKMLLEEHPPRTEADLALLYHDMQNVLQWKKACPMIAGSIEEARDQVAERFLWNEATG